MARWRPLEEYTPVARLMVDYMWEQRPPLLPSQFAARMGLPKQLVSSWLSGQATPSPAALLHLARQMQQPISQLLVSAGYTREADPLLDIPEAWTHVLNVLQRFREQHLDTAAEESKFEEVVALLLAVQTEDLENWRVTAAAPPQGPSAAGERAFWSRRRRKSEPLEPLEPLEAVDPLEAVAGEVASEETTESVEVGEMGETAPLAARS